MSDKKFFTDERKYSYIGVGIGLGIGVSFVLYMINKAKAKKEKAEEQAAQNLQGYNQRVIDDYHSIG